MGKILQEYSFNVPKRKTDTQKINFLGGRGGSCCIPCKTCNFYNKYCNGCQGNCPDRFCKGDKCGQCVNLCIRSDYGRHLSLVEGLEIGMKEYYNLPRFECKTSFIPAINKKIKFKIPSDFLSIPFYSIYDFEKKRLKISDIKDYFSTDAKVILNFYMKDDKIFHIFDLIADGIFFDILLRIKADWYHTPCFSVFEFTSCFDKMINFKKQFWVGDKMRDMGLNTIQEVLYSSPETFANRNNCIEIIHKKGIKTVSQCAQLVRNFKECFEDTRQLLINLCDVDVLFTGFGESRIQAIKSIRRKNVFFSNYSVQFKAKTLEEIKSLIKEANV